MSKRVSEIQSQFDGAITDARAAVANATPVSTDIGSISTTKLPKEASATGKEETRWVFNGASYGSWEGANSARNAEIDGRKGEASAKVEKCNTARKKLTQINTDLSEAISALGADIGKVSDFQAQVDAIGQAISVLGSNYGACSEALGASFNCSPSVLISGTSAGFSSVSKNDCSTGSFGHASSVLSDWQGKASEMQAQIGPIVSELNSKATALNAQIRQLDAMKN